MSKKILVINAGSSSIKFKLFEATTYKVVASGLCERIFIDGAFSIKYGDGLKKDLNYSMPNHTKAIECVLEQLKALKIVEDFNDIIGVGHRVVLAGANVPPSMKTTKEVKQLVRDHIKLAPLHNEPELTVVEIFEKLLPHATSVSSFDNGFHASIPPVNYIYPIDQATASKYSIRRYGFHGNSYRFIAQRMAQVLKRSTPNLIVCHLGNGASICAIKEGKSYATSMGLTPLEGVMMGTRCGDVDPSMVIYLVRQGMTVDQVDALFNKKSGMQGMLGTSDMRDVESKYNAGDKQAKLAMEMYATRVAEYILRYANQLENQVDAIVFTAGIGENSAFVVDYIIRKIKILSLTIDQTALKSKYDDFKLISTKASVFPIYCVRTDEELMIAQDVNKIIHEK